MLRSPPHSLPWSEEECAESEGKCPLQAHPPLRDHYQVLETSEFLALTASTKFISILPRAECTSLSPRKAVCRGCGQHLVVRAGQSTHTRTILGMVWAGTKRGNRREAGWASLSIHHRGPAQISWRQNSQFKPGLPGRFSREDRICFI